MFSMPHLAAMLIVAALVILCCKWAVTWQRRTVERFFKAIAIIILFFDPTYWTWEWFTTGTIDLASSLPLYICSLFWMLLPLAVFPREGMVKRAAVSCLATVCMLGGVMGLVFNPHVGKHPFFSFVPMYSIVYHFMVILVAALLWATKYYQPKPVDRFLCMVPVVLMVVVALSFSLRNGWDYSFTGGGIGTPFELVSSRVPLGVFLLILYGGLTLLLALGFYPWVLKKHCAK